MRRLPIPESVWLHGEGESSGLLLRPSDGKMCCIGIYLEACGVPKEQLKNVAAAGELVRSGVPLPEEARWLLVEGENHETGDATELYTTNDEADNEDAHESECGDDDCTRCAPIENSPEWEARRKEKIAEMFALHDVEVEFTD